MAAKRARRRSGKAGRSIVPAHIAQKRVFGSIVVTRVENLEVPAALRAPLKEFRAAHDALKTTITAMETAVSDRAHAEGEIKGVDRLLNTAIHDLANALVGASLGTRQNPFKSLSKHPPAALTKLGYSAKVKAAREMVTKLKPKKLPATVGTSLKALGLRADGVAKALGAVSAPDAALARARGSLDAVVVRWNKAMERLKTLAAAAWIDEPTTFDALFRKPARVQAPKGTRAKRAAKPAAAPAAPKEPPPEKPPAK